MPRLSPWLARSRSCTSSSGSAEAIAASRWTTTSSGMEAERTGAFAGHDLRHQRLASLPRAAELDHVRAQVVGLDEAGQRAALASASTYRTAVTRRRGESAGMPSR